VQRLLNRNGVDMGMRRFGVCLVLPLALAACGGGGGGGCLLGGAIACSAPDPANVAPVARVTSSQAVVTGSTVTLDATASTDANQDVLTYAWTFLSRPSGSQAVLSSDTAAKPTFTADVSGAYVLALTVYDGKAYSTPAAATVQATVANVAPVANAGTNQSVVVGTQVTLDGTYSSDANLGDVLSYNWTLSRPDGSLASLSSSTSVRPSFTADVAGTYLATLMVSDGRLSSALSSVRVVASAANAAPVANAGTDQSVLVSSVVNLDGTASSDANLDAITYTWSFLARPSGSVASLSSATAPKPSFTADLAGSYVLGLLVNDGKVSSANMAVVTVTAAAANAAPVANAGPNQTVAIAASVTLTGAASTDANGDVLTYAWTLVSAPTGSTASLSSSTAVSPTFTANVAGTYVFVLVVNDGKVSSPFATVSVTAQ
jgi:PKD domain